MSVKGQLELPDCFLPTGEPNRWLEQYKQARLRKWSVRSGRSLEEMSDLAAFYLAIARYDSAIEVAEFVHRHVVFAGDYNIWTFAAIALCHGAYACHRTGRIEQEMALFKPIRINPARIFGDRNQLEPEIRGERAKLLARSAEKSASARLDALTALRYQVYYFEAANFNVPKTEWFPIAELESQISLALELLRNNIEL